MLVCEKKKSPQSFRHWMYYITREWSWIFSEYFIFGVLCCGFWTRVPKLMSEVSPLILKSQSVNSQKSVRLFSKVSPLLNIVLYQKTVELISENLWYSKTTLQSRFLRIFDISSQRPISKTLTQGRQRHSQNVNIGIVCMCFDICSQRPSSITHTQGWQRLSKRQIYHLMYNIKGYGQ